MKVRNTDREIERVAWLTEQEDGSVLLNVGSPERMGQHQVILAVKEDCVIELAENCREETTRMPTDKKGACRVRAGGQLLIRETKEENE